jgi:hypothetical protein
MLNQAPCYSWVEGIGGIASGTLRWNVNGQLHYSVAVSLIHIKTMSVSQSLCGRARERELETQNQIIRII